MSAVYLKAVLNINGNEILHASTGTEVVEMMRSNPDTDVVLMDISMPGQNGYEATRQIRQFNKGVVIIVQSGYAFEDSVKQAAEVGFESAKFDLAVKLGRKDCVAARRMLTDLVETGSDAAVRKSAQQWLNDEYLCG